MRGVAPRCTVPGVVAPTEERRRGHSGDTEAEPPGRYDLGDDRPPRRTGDAPSEAVHEEQLQGDVEDVGANNDQGSAYVFKRNGTTWSQQQKLTATGGTASSRFGSAVTIYPNVAIISILGATERTTF